MTVSDWLPLVAVIGLPLVMALVGVLSVGRCRTYVPISAHEGSLPHRLPPMRYWHLCRYCGKPPERHD